MNPKINLFWFRRDLRIDDNTGLYFALKDGLPVVPVFVFDTDILSHFPGRADPRLDFIFKALDKLKSAFEKAGGSLLVKKGKPVDVFRQITEELPVAGVFTNHDYEPNAIQRDEAVRGLLSDRGILFRSFKDQVIFEKNEILNNNDNPYTVFTPYSRKWLQKYQESSPVSYDTLPLLNQLQKMPPLELPSLENMGYKKTRWDFPPDDPGDELLMNYHKTRDFPAIRGTSRLGIHLRFGTLSMRKLVKRAFELNRTFLNELIWREFYMMILAHFPHAEKQPFRQQYERIDWINQETDFKRWCEGTTGYPLVDAGMRELNDSGFMHNRVRMVTASFLTKHLLIDWRWGEHYFAQKLLDYELASNNGGWQWAAGSGCDAAPYFRVFNPLLQAERFDPRQEYIKKWIPEIYSTSYPKAMVDHPYARARAILTYKKALS